MTNDDLLIVAERALKPFADAAESLDENHSDRMDLWESPSSLEITAGHLRAARDFIRLLRKPG